MSNPAVELILDQASKHVPNVRQLLQDVDHPDKIDDVTKARGLAPRSFNLHLASRVTSAMGPGLYVPVQIARSNGGRKSLYYLDVGEEVVAGALITHDQIYYWHVKRDSGTSGLAKTGDFYTVRYTNLAGQEKHKVQAKLEILDETKGIGRLQGNDSIWVLWSCIKIEESA